MNPSRNRPKRSAHAVKSLVAGLGSKDSETRMNAHKSLVDKGESVLNLLVEALSNPNERVRYEAGKILDEIKVPWSQHADTTTIRSLINDLRSADGLVRIRARRALVAIGNKAVPSLESALASKDISTRWEAAKALEQIGDPEATTTLIKALEDKLFDIRWLAAEGLIAIGRPALVPLLRKLSEKPDSLWLREGTHRILRAIETGDLRDILLPVLKALEDLEAPIEAPFAARSAIELLKKAPTRRPPASSKRTLLKK